MKKLLNQIAFCIFCFLLVSPALTFAQTGKYELKIKLTNLSKPAKAYLINSYGWTNQKIVDSAVLDKGLFKFSSTLEEPAQITLLVDHTGNGKTGWSKTADVLTFYLEKGSIRINGKDSVKTAKVKAGKVNGDYLKYQQTVFSKLKAESDRLNQIFISGTDQQKKDPKFMASLNEQYKLAVKANDSLKYVFIKQNPNSFLSLAALNELSGQDPDVQQINPIFKRLSPALQNTPFGVALAKKLNDQGALAIDAMAPAFTQNDVNDKPVSLSDFKGKYVLIDFWASWCGPCRAENPNVLKAYSNYKDKGFEVLGISLDQPGKKDAWLAAIAKDGLPWTQVSDLKFWNNAVARQYQINSIPQNFLIDPSGKIIAKNLRGEKLQEKLRQLFQ